MSEPRQSEGGPARIILTGSRGKEIRVNIGKINSNVSVAKTAFVKTSYGRSRRDSSSSDSSSDGDGKPGVPPSGAVTIHEQHSRYFQMMKKPLDRQRRVGEGLCRQISQHFEQGWRRVFRHLGMSDTVIDRVYEESEGVQDCVYKLLMEWVKDCSTPTIQTLVEALVRADQAQVVEHIH